MKAHHGIWNYNVLQECSSFMFETCLRKTSPNRSWNGHKLNHLNDRKCKDRVTLKLCVVERKLIDAR